jgi:hypothetical protein
MFVPILLAAWSSAPAPGPLVVREVTVVDVRAGTLLPNRWVTVRDGRIVSVTAGAVDTSGLTVIDGRGLYLVPGLADLHAHLDEDDLDLMLANGITTVREMNGDSTRVAWRTAIRSGQRIGPTLFVSSPLLTGKALPFRHALIETPEMARIYAVRFAAQGYDLLKVYDDLSPEAYMAIATIAEEQGIPFVGHIPDEVGLRFVVGHGQASIEHAEQILQSTVDHDFDPAGILPIVAMMADKETALTPTLAAAEILSDQRSSWFPSLYARPEMRYAPVGVRGWWNSIRRSGGREGPVGGDGAYITFQRQLTLALWEAGVPILVGTDTPNPLLVPGFSLVHELQALERAGIPRAAVLRAATLGAAEHLGSADTVGTIEEGRRADLVLLAGNPLDDLGALRDVRGVVVRGEWLAPARLAAMLARVAERRAGD